MPSETQYIRSLPDSGDFSTSPEFMEGPHDGLYALAGPFVSPLTVYCQVLFDPFNIPTNATLGLVRYTLKSVSTDAADMAMTLINDFAYGPSAFSGPLADTDVVFQGTASQFGATISELNAGPTVSMYFDLNDFVAESFAIDAVELYVEWTTGNRRRSFARAALAGFISMNSPWLKRKIGSHARRNRR